MTGHRRAGRGLPRSLVPQLTAGPDGITRELPYLVLPIMLRLALHESRSPGGGQSPPRASGYPVQRHPGRVQGAAVKPCGWQAVHADPLQFWASASCSRAALVRGSGLAAQIPKEVVVPDQHGVFAQVAAACRRPNVARASLAVAYQAFRGFIVSMTRKVASCRPGLYQESFDSQRYCPTPSIHGPTGRTWIGLRWPG